MGLLSGASQARGMMDLFLCAFVYPELSVNSLDMSGKNVIVTGANVGIGLECARKLASYGARVTLVCRDPAKGELARQDITGTTGNTWVDVKKADFSSFESVRTFVTDWGDKPIDVLINNAGVTPNKFARTPDGYEATYQTNFLSHVLLTILLLPHLNESARIVNVSSLANYFPSRQALDPRDLDGSDLITSKGVKEGELLDMNPSLEIYQRSKLSQVVFTRALQEKLDASSRYGGRNLAVFACNPGLVTSSIYERHAGASLAGFEKTMKTLHSFARNFGISTEQGACCPVYLAVDPYPSTTKYCYWDRNTARTPNPLVEDEALRNELWPAWLKECGIADPL